MKILNLFIIVCLFAGITTMGQEKKSNPLKLIIKTNKKNICFENSFEFITEITNIGENPIVIDINQIGYTTDFSWSISKPGRHEGGAFTLIGENNLNIKPNFVILQPNRSYIEDKLLVFDDENLMKTQNFKMQISYGQFLERNFANIVVWKGVIESNEIDIFVEKKCDNVINE